MNQQNIGYRILAIEFIIETLLNQGIQRIPSIFVSSFRGLGFVKNNFNCNPKKSLCRLSQQEEHNKKIFHIGFIYIIFRFFWYSL